MLHLSSTNDELDKMEEFFKSENLIESLNLDTFTKTAQKVTEEIQRRSEVNSNINKL